jgi:hypothetical protein
MENNFVEKRVICPICFNDHPKNAEMLVFSTDKYYYNFLIKYNLHQLCNECSLDGYDLYSTNKPSFMDWLDEHDNRNETQVSTFNSLRESYHIFPELIETSPDEYMDNLEKYIMYLENVILVNKCLEKDTETL